MAVYTCLCYLCCCIRWWPRVKLSHISADPHQSVKHVSHFTQSSAASDQPALCVRRLIRPIQNPQILNTA